MKEFTNFYAVTGGLCVTHREPCVESMCRYHLHGDAKLEQIEIAPIPRTTCTLKLANRGGMTLEEIGLSMGITRERVRQIERTATSKLCRVLKRRGFTSDDFLHFHGGR